MPWNRLIISMLSGRGAAAFNRIDDWSDIDLCIAVDDQKVDETFIDAEKALRSLSQIKRKYKIPQSPELGFSQAFYTLENASEYLIIDLAIFKLSSPDKFLEPEIHGKVIFYFNKSDRVRPPPLDRGAFAKKLQERFKRLQARFDMFNNFIQKEINRSNSLEAIGLYHVLTMATLIEALRIKYSPIHHSFKMRYIHYELPSQVISELKHLYFVRNEKDMLRNIIKQLSGLSM